MIPAHKHLRVTEVKKTLVCNMIGHKAHNEKAPGQCNSFCDKGKHRMDS